MRRVFYSLFAVLFLATTGLAEGLFDRVSATAGICVLMPAGDGSLPIGLAKQSKLLVYTMADNPAELATVQQAAVAAGLLGRRLFVEQGDGKQLPFADNFVDVVVLAASALSVEEAKRVLVPGGQLFIRDGADWRVETKPTQPEVADWTHWGCSADNNSLSPDTVLKPPYQVQFIETPYYIPLQAVTLAAGGRYFIVTGSGKGEEAELSNAIFCRSGYNGRLLWQQPVAWDSRQTANVFHLAVATADEVCLGVSNSVIRLDARTGKQLGRMESSGVLKWIAWSDGILYTLDEADRFAVGEAWKHQESAPVEPRLTAVRDGQLVFVAGDTVHCREGRTGRTLWSHPLGPRSKFSSQGEAPGLVLTPKLAWLRQPGTDRLIALSRGDGKGVAEYKAGAEFNALTAFWSRSANRVYAVLSTGPKALDAVTGAVLDELVPISLHITRCARLTANESASFHMGWQNRAGCRTGLIVGNGMLYAGSSSNCGCNHKLVGQIGLAPAARNPATLAVSKSMPDVFSNRVQPLTVTGNDWPEYRANANRTASTRVAVGRQLKLLWETEAGGPAVTAGGAVFVGGQDGRVRCFDAATGRTRWWFATGAAIRLPPTIWESRAYVGSADGYVYCLEAASGRLLWRFRPDIGPRRLINLYGTLASQQPVNTGVLIRNGVAYAGAGFVDVQGTCLFALNAYTGEPKWINATCGVVSNSQGVSASGGLSFAGDHLLVGGAAQPTPATIAAATGELRLPGPPYTAPFYPTGREVMVWNDRWVIYGGQRLYAPASPTNRRGWSALNALTFGFWNLTDSNRVAEVHPVGLTTVPPAWDADLFVMPTFEDGDLCAWTPTALDTYLEEIRAGKETGFELSQAVGGPEHPVMRLTDKAYRAPFAHKRTKWGPLPFKVRAVVVTRDAVVVTGLNFLRGLDKQTGATLWELPLPAPPLPDGVAVDRDGRLLVSLLDGRLLCYQKQ